MHLFEHSANDLELWAQTRVLVPALLDAIGYKARDVGEERQTWSEHRSVNGVRIATDSIDDVCDE
jgi:hypothetical protein